MCVLVDTSVHEHRATVQSFTSVYGKSPQNKQNKQTEQALCHSDSRTERHVSLSQAHIANKTKESKTKL